MRARACWVAAALMVPLIASADPKPKAVEIKAFRDQLVVLADALGGTYVVLPGSESRLWFAAAAGKPFYEQIVVNRGADGSTGAWDVGVWEPQIPRVQPGSVLRKADGTYLKFCGDEHQTGLTQVTGDKAKAVLDKGVFMSSAMIRRPHAFARDDAGVYYYVDEVRPQYGGQGFRVFVGKKGAMKQVPLSDIASDSAGEVFSTKTGDLRIVLGPDSPTTTTGATWVRGEKRVPLVVLDLDVNSPVIYRDLGVYGFTGSICDDF